MNAKSERILVGTASWSDPGFVERWYPTKMPAGERLAWYALHFEMVEVNSTFYSIPDPRMVERWCRSTPVGFTFDVKLHQLLSRHSTNIKLLPPVLQRQADVDGKGRVKLTREIERETIEQLREPIEILRDAGKLGVLLLQLSPAFSPKMHKLSELDDLLGEFKNDQLAIELRNRNWAEGEQLDATLEFLREHGAAFVLVDAPTKKHFTIMPSDLNEITTSEVAYLRLHVFCSRHATSATVKHSDSRKDSLESRAFPQLRPTNPVYTYVWGSRRSRLSLRNAWEAALPLPSCSGSH